MTNKIVKKTGFQITDVCNFGSVIQIETDENLEKVENFINNTGIANSIGMLKNRLFGEKITKNAINVIGGSENKILESGFEGERKEIPTKIAVNLIENSSLEDGEELQDIWSNMLANAVTGKVDIKNSYIDILKQLTKGEVVFLNFIFNNIEDIKSLGANFDIKNQGYSKTNLIQFLDLSESDFEVIVDNLVRLNLVHTGIGEEEGSKDESYKSLHMKRGLILLTCLGYEFVRACKFK